MVLCEDPGLRFAPTWAMGCQPFGLQSALCELQNNSQSLKEGKLFPKPERLACYSPGRSEAEAWVFARVL